MKNDVQIFRERTVLVKWTWEKVVVNAPFKAVNELMQKNTIKIWVEHFIKTSAINERFAYNLTDSDEFWVQENYPTIADEVLLIISQRRKEKKRVNKGIITIIAKRILNTK